MLTLLADIALVCGDGGMCLVLVECYLLLVECYLLLVECYLSLFSVPVDFLFPLLAEIVLVSKIVECV